MLELSIKDESLSVYIFVQEVSNDNFSIAKNWLEHRTSIILREI
jgi:hypothetical protein